MSRADRSVLSPPICSRNVEITVVLSRFSLPRFPSGPVLVPFERTKAGGCHEEEEGGRRGDNEGIGKGEKDEAGDSRWIGRADSPRIRNVILARHRDIIALVCLGAAP